MDERETVLGKNTMAYFGVCLAELGFEFGIRIGRGRESWFSCWGMLKFENRFSDRLFYFCTAEPRAQIQLENFNYARRVMRRDMGCLILWVNGDLQFWFTDRSRRGMRDSFRDYFEDIFDLENEVD